MIGDSSGHRWSHTQRFVHPAKIVKREPHGNSGPVVLKFLAERIRKACEAASAHANTEILAFHNRRADSFGVRLTHDWDYLRGCTSAGLYRASPSCDAR